MRERFRNIHVGAHFLLVEDVNASLKGLQREPILGVYTKDKNYMLIIGPDGEKRQVSPDAVVIEVILVPSAPL